jgi:hypothetical protein
LIFWASHFGLGTVLLLPSTPQGEAVFLTEKSMAEPTEQEIKARAYKIWERMGCPQAKRMNAGR